MQQHTGQHVLSAVAETIFGWVTLSWALGEKRSSVELQIKDNQTPTQEQLWQLEHHVNQIIAEARPVSIVTESDHVDRDNFRENEKAEQVMHESEVKRVVQIQNLDSNPWYDFGYFIFLARFTQKITVLQKYS